MKPMSYWITLFGFMAAMGTHLMVAAEGDAKTHAAGAATEMKHRIAWLWSDRPAYVAQLEGNGVVRKVARLISSVSPVFPPELVSIKTANVSVALVIDEAGAVEDVRVLESTDARFEQAALDAVRQWRFSPAEGESGGPVRSFSVAPIVFQSLSPEQRAIGLSIHPLVRDLKGRLLSGHIGLTGGGASDVKAGRVLVVSARDDVGTELQQAGSLGFYRPAVGSISAEDWVRTPFPAMSYSLALPAAAATEISLVEGTVELVIPAIDPKATARIDGLAYKLGVPLESPELREAGVTVVVFDKASCDRFMKDQKPGGPADYDTGAFFGLRSPDLPDDFMRGLVMEASDLAVGIDDPQGRLAGFEFQAAGESLYYNHNGRYHSGASPGKRFAVYSLQASLPEDAIMVCWLITPKSLVKVPLRLEHLPLPR